MDMPSVEDTLHSGAGEVNVERGALVHDQQQDIKRISRVSKLRDMFQNGMIRPIEEIDNVLPFEESLPECDRHPDMSMFPMSFPGSPPLSALRAHRMNMIANSKPCLETNECTSHPTRTCSPASAAAQQSPPTCPPKPHPLVIDRYLRKNVSQATSQTAMSPSPTTPAEKEYCLKSCIQLFENGCSKPVAGGRLHNGASSSAPLVTARAEVTLDTEVAAVPGGKLSATDGHVFPREVAASVSITPTTCAVTSTPVASSPPSLQADKSPMTTSAIEPRDSLRDSLTQDAAADLNASVYPTPMGRLGAWKGSATRSRGQNPISEDCRQLILQPADFRSSSGDAISACLQHAEAVAVGTPDEKDGSKPCPPDRDGGVEDKPGSGEPCVAMVGGPVQPTLPVPNGLHVVAVDAGGVHILEDGNFFYAIPRSLVEEKIGGDGSGREAARDLGFPGKETDGRDLHDYLDGGEAKARLPLTVDDEGQEEDEERKPRVRFSTEPVLVYSTHSVTEYNRRNDDIDPLGASAEYELEKQLENMEKVNVDLEKGPQGLGFSILGLGVDQFGADQKLGIFIKLLTPGGAAEADGRIQIYDQIVEVDGISLVGVTSEFAASTLRSTQDVVHFVMAREKDPTNSRVAKLLRQQEEMQDFLDGDRQLESEGEYNDNKEEAAMNGRAPGDRFHNDPNTMVSSLPREDSYETLRKQTSAESADDDELEPSRQLELTADPVFESTGMSELSSATGVLPQLTLSPDSSSSPRPAKPGTSLPRSALKGTATAASTLRRGEAIDLLISLAAKEVRQSFPTDHPVDMADRVAWYLASNLHDCQIVLAKQRGQLRNMEQRLTAQEAAADEAIERLCLQCRHTEAELGRVAEQLKQQQEQYFMLVQQHHPALSPKPFGHMEAVRNGSPGSSRKPLPNDNGSCYGQNNDEAASHSVPVNSDTPLALANATAEAEASDSTHLSASRKLSTPSSPVRKDQSSPGFPPSLRGALSGPAYGDIEDSSASLGATMTVSTSEAGGQPMPTLLQQAYAARLSLLKSTGLSRRRPPTQIVVAPPLCLMPSPEQTQKNSTRTSHTPPLVEATSEGNSYPGTHRTASATPAPPPVAPPHPRPLPVSHMHRRPQQAVGVAEQSMRLSNRGKVASDCDVSQAGAGGDVGNLARMASTSGVFSAERLPSGEVRSLSPHGSPVRRRVMLPSPVPSNRPQPIRSPGHPTPQQQLWFAGHQSTPTRSAANTPPS